MAHVYNHRITVTVSTGTLSAKNCNAKVCDFDNDHCSIVASTVCVQNYSDCGRVCDS